MSWSPNFNKTYGPFLKVCFNKTGSNIGSSSSSTFSSKNGYPNLIQFSKILAKLASDNFPIYKLFPPYNFLIHEFA